jgi:hypothetical protein
MNVAEKIGSVTSDLKAKGQEIHSQKLQQSNEELKRENTLLRQQVEEDANSRDRVLALLDRMEMTPRQRKRRGWIRILVVAGGAYVLGARAGRERYEQIRRSWSRKLNRPPADDVIDRLKDAGQMAKSQAESAAYTVKEQVDAASQSEKAERGGTARS